MRQPDLFGGPEVTLTSMHGTAVDDSGRRVLDAYYTPPGLASTLVGLLDLPRGTHVVEPSAGGGSFVRALTARGCRVTAVDLDPHAIGLQQATSGEVADFLDWRPVGNPSWVVGNPPYGDAEAHVRHALDIAGRGVAMLLRLAFLESSERVPFWAQWPASWVYVLAQRPSFTGGGTDSAAYGWFVWGDLRHPSRREWATRMQVLSWR